MSWCSNISGNGIECIIAMTIANQVAQWFKVLRLAYASKSFNLSMLLASGGMPSSHSSTVTGLTASVGWVSGFSSVEFAIACCVSIVVMYDAAGVRRAAGRQAKILNQMVQSLFSPEHHFSKEKLKEFLGHTPTEVFAGATLGIIVATLLHYVLIYFSCNQ
jgi:acid phosphatase family membrane protein YuiD